MMLNDLLQNQVIRYIMALIVGVTVGVVFYPSKKIEEKVSLKYEDEISSLKETHQKEISKQQEEYTKLSTEYNSYHKESESKISSLITQVSNLKNSKKTTYYKIVHPDGTVEIRKTLESESESSTEISSQIQKEYQQKVDDLNKSLQETHDNKISELQKQFDSKEQDYKHTIEDLQKTKTTTINEKHFGVSVGILSDKSYFGDVNVDVWGPLYLDMFGSYGPNTNNSSLLGIGGGIRF